MVCHLSENIVTLVYRVKDRLGNFMLRRLLCVCLIGAGIAFSAYPAKAQGVGEGIELNIEEKLFPNTKKGCEMRSGFNFAMIKSYQNGDSPSGIASFKMLEPMITKTFDTIRENGVSQAHINNVTEYQECIKTAQPVGDPEKELLLVSKHTSCSEFADVILATLSGIQARQKIETILEKYKEKKIDFADTGFEDLTFKGEDLPENMVQDPLPMFIKQIYGFSETSYDNAVEQGAGMIIGCFTGN